MLMEPPFYYDLGSLLLLRDERKTERDTLVEAIAYTEKELAQLKERLSRLDLRKDDGTPQQAKDKPLDMCFKKTVSADNIWKWSKETPKCILQKPDTQACEASETPSRRHGAQGKHDECREFPVFTPKRLRAKPSAFRKSVSFGNTEDLEDHGEQVTSQAQLRSSDGSVLTQSRIDHTPREWRTGSCAYSAEDLRGHVLALSLCGKGCKLLQSVLDEGSDPHAAAELMKTELKGHFCDVVKKTFGKFLIPKVVRLCDEKSRQDVLSEIFLDPRNSLMSLAQNENALYAIQRLVPYFSPRVSELVVSEVIRAAQLLAVEERGKYFLKAIFASQTYHNAAESVAKLYDHIVDPSAFHLRAVCEDKVGCTSICFAIQSALPQQLRAIHAALSRSLTELALNKYGNYVVQELILSTKERAPHDLDSIAVELAPDLLGVACHKFGSNVVERLIESSDTPTFETVMYTLLKLRKNADGELTPSTGTAERVSRLSEDSFGSYVLQTCLNTAEERHLGHRIIALLNSNKGITKSTCK